MVAPTATPQGVACLMMAQAGSWNDAAIERAACRSSRLLNVSGGPPSCSIIDSRWRRAPTST